MDMRRGKSVLKKDARERREEKSRKRDKFERKNTHPLRYSTIRYWQFRTLRGG
jgi:hypothetical protein